MARIKSICVAIAAAMMVGVFSAGYVAVPA